MLVIEDILVGMFRFLLFKIDIYRFEKRVGKIFWFNKSGLLIEIIFFNEKELYCLCIFKFIIENNNGDVVILVLNMIFCED